MENNETTTKLINHSRATIQMAFCFVFQVKYRKWKASPRNAFTNSNNVETRWRKINNRLRQHERIAKVFPLSQLTSGTPYIRYMGMLTSALRRSTRATLATRMFGKVRSFLNRTMMPRINPLPSNEEMIKVERHAAIEIMLVGLLKGMVFICTSRVEKYQVMVYLLSSSLSASLLSPSLYKPTNDHLRHTTIIVGENE